MNWQKYLIVAAAGTLLIVGYTKLIWQSGFDQGADVSLCVVASFQNGGKLAHDSGACQDAHAYQSNPLWVLRRREEPSDDRS